MLQWKVQRRSDKEPRDAILAGSPFLDYIVWNAVSQADRRTIEAEMARSKEFETKHALAAAMNVFWRLGYENTSLEVLMREMGVAKQSLYDTFGDKRALYFKAMAFYREETNSSMRRLLVSAPTVKEGFAGLFQGLIAESREKHERGCLLLSPNMERAVGDRGIAEFLRDNQRESEASST